MNDVKLVTNGTPTPESVAFTAWLASAGKGDRYVYHRYHYTRHENPKWRWAMVGDGRTADGAGVRVFVDSVGGAAHAAYLGGKVNLFQRRTVPPDLVHGLGAFEYLAVRR